MTRLRMISRLTFPGSKQGADKPSRARLILPLAILTVTGVLLSAASSSVAKPDVEAESMDAFIEERCASCHRFAGEPRSKFKLEAPDLMWAGQKYQRDWLLGYLQGEEPSPYPGAYRWDKRAEKKPHPELDADKAKAVADWLEAEARSPLVEEGSFDPGTITEYEVETGKRLYRDYSCAACHQIPTEDGPYGGPVSTHFLDAGRRYDPDWVHAFNEDPSAFAPHSGEYVPDVSARKERMVTGYMLTLGVEDFTYAKPWQGEAFQNADAEHGGEVFRTYCAQCHGLEGKGDGPAAPGLDPRPAKLTEMALDELELQYLYELIFYGGKAVGKSTLMPDWGATLTTPQIADVIAYLRTTFDEPAAATAGGTCPQPRSTPKAPTEIYERENPLEPTEQNLAAGRALYEQKAKPLTCQKCHGAKGDGQGPLAAGYSLPPRNFTCAETMREIPEGQLFWVIRNGITKAGMPPYRGLSDEQVWQLVLYLRSFYKQ